MASSITSQNAFSGARAEIYAGEFLVGRAQGINGTYNIVNVAADA